MVNFKYFVLLICFAQILYCSAADNSTSVASSIVGKVVPNCFFGVQTISFNLYTRNVSNGIVFEAENITRSNILKENIHPDSSVIIFTHGFTSSANTTGYYKLTQAMLEKFDNAVIIAIDWKEGACSGGLSLIELAGYLKAVENTREVGQYIANLTKTLIEEYDVKLDKMVVIGHSLGAHVMGFAGKEIQNLKLGKYPQIIGLDPASPSFDNEDCSERLCVTDADYVQIIHTTMTFGITTPIGVVDFYMNKGHLQPGCYGNPICSHSKAVEYLTESVTHECCFIGTPWENYFATEPISECTEDTCVCVGFNARNYPARGKFYVEIEEHSPHCNNNGMVL